VAVRDEQVQAEQDQVGQRPVRLWQAALLALCVVRLLVASVLPLVDDEAYYWAWSQRLALSYFDHPAGGAVLIRLSTSLLGQTPFAVHLPAILCLAGASWLLGRLFTRLSPDRPATAWKAVLLMNLAPTMGILGTVMLPDPPMLLCWVTALYCLHVALEDDRPELWYAVGAAGALALVAKYTAVLLPVSVLLYLMASPRHRRWLRRPEPWAAAAIMLLGAVPILAWNVQHDWASIRFHFVDRHPAVWQPLNTLGRFLASQLLLTPGLVFFCVAGWVAAFRRARAGDEASRFIVWLSVPSALFFTALGLVTMTFPYWTAVSYLLAFLPAVRLLDAQARWMRVSTWAVAGGVSAVIFAHACWPVAPVGTDGDPAAKLHGWPEVADRAAALATACGDRPCFVFAHRYMEAALVSFYLPPALEVTRLTGRHDQYDIWRDEAALDGRDAIYLSDSLHRQRPNATFPFAQCDAAGSLPIVRGERLLRTVYFWRCRGYRSLRPAP